MGKLRLTEEHRKRCLKVLRSRYRRLAYQQLQACNDLMRYLLSSGKPWFHLNKLLRTLPKRRLRHLLLLAMQTELSLTLKAQPKALTKR